MGLPRYLEQVKEDFFNNNNFEKYNKNIVTSLRNYTKFGFNLFLGAQIAAVSYSIAKEKNPKRLFAHSIDYKKGYLDSRNIKNLYKDYYSFINVVENDILKNHLAYQTNDGKLNLYKYGNSFSFKKKIKDAFVVFLDSHDNYVREIRMSEKNIRSFLKKYINEKFTFDVFYVDSDVEEFTTKDKRDPFFADMPVDKSLVRRFFKDLFYDFDNGADLYNSKYKRILKRNGIKVPYQRGIYFIKTVERKRKKALSMEQGRRFTGLLRQAILDRDNYKCVLCGKTVADGISLEVDHIKQWSDGGKTIYENGRTLCSDCNKGIHQLKKKKFIKADQ